jgi:hypothetical protein
VGAEAGASSVLSSVVIFVALGAAAMSAVVSVRCNFGYSSYCGFVRSMRTEARIANRESRIGKKIRSFVTPALGPFGAEEEEARRGPPYHPKAEMKRHGMESRGTQRQMS